MSATEKTALSLVAGSASGAAATLATYPLDLLRTRLAAQGEPKVYKGMFHAASTIVRKKGVSGLYAGLVPTLVQILPYAGVQFLAYDGLRSAVVASKERRRGEGPQTSATVSSLESFFLGVAAGVVSKCVVHPLDVIKKRLQVQGLNRSIAYGARVACGTYSGTRDAMVQVLRTEGVAGLYKGIAPSLIKAAPNAAITFMVYEWASRRLSAAGI